ncbi:MAG: hypothetical protein L0211_18120 [Planctomycetaceae bacterium]|nr:hypothetical protein [Planctomycetaceae bacterium]
MSDSRRPEDEAIEAIVYDVHPALLQPGLAPRRAAMAYPYGPQVQVVRPTDDTTHAVGENPFHVRPQDLYREPAQSLFHFDFTESKVDYVVPPRFGLSAILGMTTALAILFGCMRFLDAAPAWYLFYGFQSIVICVVQMFQGRSPRRASAIAGAILGPLFLLGTAIVLWGEQVEAGFVLFLVVMMVPCGAFLGYLNGTCAAGIFLVMDKLEQYLKGESTATDSPISPPAVPAS